MTKPMKYRDLVRMLRDAGFDLVPGRGKGDHEVWEGPGGVKAVLVRDTECSPGLTGQALDAIRKADAIKNTKEK